MTAEKPTVVVPKLRFPEFRGDPDWEQAALGALLDRSPEYGVNAAAVPFSEGLPAYIRITDIDDDGRFEPAPLVSVDIDPSDGQFLRPGDIVLARTGASVGKSYRYRAEDGRLVFAGFLIRVTPNPHRLVPEFLSGYLSTWSYWDWVRLTSARSGQPGINGNEYASMPLPKPADAAGLSEQRKIADCLGSVDDLIAAEGRKLEALRQHKLGLMQQLFPQPGETVPLLRFPEFGDAPDWEEERLGSLVAITSGKSPSQYALFSQGDCAFVKVEDLNNCTKYQVDGREYCNDVRDAVPSGSILFPKRGAAIENNKIRITASEILIDTNLMALTPHDTAATEFLYYYLVRVGLAQIADTSTIPQINNKHIIPYRVLVPSESERLRIADCLAMLDDRIAAHARGLGVLKRHKQGLLQQLFPSPEGD